MEASGRADVGRTVREDIEDGLRRRTTPEHTKARRLEDWTKRRGAFVWQKLKAHSYTGVLAFGAAGVLIADLVGVGELAVGAVLAYGAFRVLRRGERAEEAAEDVIQQLERA